MTTMTAESIAPTVYRLIDWLHAARWSSPEARERGLRRLIVAARGSRAVVDEREFARRVARLATQWGLPGALRAKVRRHERTLRDRTLQDAATHAAHAVAYYAAAAAAHAASAAATRAGHCAAYDATLVEFAEHVVRILCAMGSPGAANLPNCDGRHGLEA